MLWTVTECLNQPLLLVLLEDIDRLSFLLTVYSSPRVAPSVKEIHTASLHHSAEETRANDDRQKRRCEEVIFGGMYTKWTYCSLRGHAESISQQTAAANPISPPECARSVEHQRYWHFGRIHTSMHTCILARGRLCFVSKYHLLRFPRTLNHRY